MAGEPRVELKYTEGCGDCGQRHVELPATLVDIGDDFDWDVRDYDGYRLFMLEELAARFPERKNWTPADMEVMLVETLAVVLDQLSDMNDRIQAEAFLETARRPDTVRRLLAMIGYKAALHTDKALLDEIAVNNPEFDDNKKLEMLWSYYPHLMAEAKKAGPRSIHQQHRMVTQDDYKNQLLAHPLVLDVDAYTRWTGSWYGHYVVVRIINNMSLDEVLSKSSIAPDAEGDEERNDIVEHFNEQLTEFYQSQEIDLLPDVEGKTSRYLLQQIIDRQRMIGQEVILSDVTLVGIVLSISVRISGDYYRSEIKDAINESLINQSDGFFAPGYFQFGEDVVASDVIEVLMNLDGIDSICINRMKRIGSIYSDQSGSGRIVLEGHEVAVLDNDISKPELGVLKISLHGGKSG
ncbi:hypothetical protein [sulfur-oxidizing endosymbiont of Gigantopelta aegis]|uniref:hypothetical protein n=1 Tax=sulfur-oxidizing endosymbiont of Gigantopelta aegis TaxID=2794934 RepID=UPI0018DDC089|nr:hypothetical protein [sulfur-oxidizing endosymbiont of Gigantopelta aegis]